MQEDEVVICGQAGYELGWNEPITAKAQAIIAQDPFSTGFH
jgi:hypothetical protein